ncbi:MAG: AIR synthase-related protein, partial [Candidatus Micrarchaeota archaeon]|nr:AIR synthase-related protein [Candidatus Micrarchaeota archaeon]
ALGGILPDEQTFWSACDNFCVPDSVHSERNPDGKYKLAQLVRLCEGIHDYAVELGIPFTSGKDSMKNDLVYEKSGKFHRISVPPTLLISLVAKIADFRATKSMDFKAEGDRIYVVGVTREELGGSQYLESLESRAGRVPTVDPIQAKRLFDAMSRALGHAESSRYVSQGGLALAFVESALAGGLGARVDLNAVAREKIDRSDLLWTSESQNRFLVSVRPERAADFENALAGIPFACVGTVTKQTALEIIRLDGKKERISLTEANQAYTAPLREDLPDSKVS